MPDSFDLTPVDYDPFPEDSSPQLERIPPQMNIPAQTQWGAQTAANVLGNVTGISDAARAWRGEMTPEEQRNFALTAAAGMIPGARALKPAVKATEEILPRYAPSEALRSMGFDTVAYHATGRDFSQFQPSAFRGATFFAHTPEAASVGAQAGAGDLTGSGSRAVVPVFLKSSDIRGLSPTPAETEWWNNLPARGNEKHIDAALKNNPTDFEHWYDVYDEHQKPDGSFEYIKKPVPSISFVQAAESGRDVYGKQIAHWGPQTSEKNTAQKAREAGMSGFLQADESGISIGHADPSPQNVRSVFAQGPIRAYHGSPYDFEKFDLSKIGTGEGAQAYGHGLYFAENPAVSETYKGMNDPKFLVGGKPIDPESHLAKEFWNDMLYNKSDQPDIDRMLITAQYQKEQWGTPYYDKLLADLADAKQKGVVNTAPIGKMYEVSIAADPDHFLHWDKPLSEQSPYVQKVFDYRPHDITDEMIAARRAKGDNGTADFLESQRLHLDTLGAQKPAQIYNLNDPGVVEKLRDAGIPGIKYLDQGSRGNVVNPGVVKADEGWFVTDAGRRLPSSPGPFDTEAAANAWIDKNRPTHNYVVFDDKLINIIKKYGLAGLTTMGAAHFATTPVEGDPFSETKRATGGRVVASNIDTDPTEAQKKAGNYAKDHVSIHGLDITIENAKGHERRGVDKGGKPWAVTMPAHYGYVKRTEGKDGDHVDVYLGSHKTAPTVYVVDQMNAETGAFDEHKCFMGFASIRQVVECYKRAFSDGKAGARLGFITPMPIDKFKHWLEHEDTTKAVVQQAKHSHAAVDYVAKSKVPNERCALCKKFVRPQFGGPACLGVVNPINAAGWCRKFMRGNLASEEHAN